MSGHAGAGYSGKPLWQKLGLHCGQAVLVVDAPADYADLVGLAEVELRLLGPRAAFEFAHVFASRRVRLRSALQRLARRLPANGTLWVSWPKKSSPLDSDISEDTIRELALPLGLVDVKVSAVDADWSALKGGFERVAQSSWRSEGSPQVLRGDVKAGCLDEPRGACGGPSGRHPCTVQPIAWAAPACVQLFVAPP